MKYDIAVVGGGIVGLATAWKILTKKPGIKLALIEKESGPSHHQTGHNSGVIHSGLYYKPGSLKAINCTQGYSQLIDFCRAEEIEFDLCGKIVVATEQHEIPLLNTLYQRGLENGLDGLKIISSEEIKEYEPHVSGLQGIHVPQTGIIDYKVVSEKLAAGVQNLGGSVYYSEKVLNVIEHNSHNVIETSQNKYEANLVINCAGLYSDKVARMSTSDINLKIVPFRGEYYKLKPESSHLVKNLIYPVPDPNFPFLGVHFTRMIGGGIEAGPNAVLAYSREGYTKSDINISELLETLAWPGFQKVAFKYWKTGMGEMYRSYFKSAFTRALQKLIPEIKSSDLESGGSGVRAQACDRNGGLLDDFNIIQSENFISVCNAPSPAATSSLSIGDTVSDLAIKRL